MKKKIISAALAATLVITSAMPAFATPSQEVIDANRNKYDELTKKIEDINSKIYDLDAQMEPLTATIESNNSQMEQIKVEVENTKNQIATAKEEIANTEEVLGKRIRELYKSGGQSSYIMLLFSADSFNDLISKIQSTNRLVKIDRKLVKELQDKQDSLNNKITSLDEKDKQLKEVNEETKKALSDLEGKKSEQQVLVEQVEAEQEEFDREFLSVDERGLVEEEFKTISDTNSITKLQDIIISLKSKKDKQFKSEIVKEEINSKIEEAKDKIDRLKAEQAAANRPASTPASTPNRGDSTVSASGNAIVNYAYQLLGKPYVYGATGPNSFDCSGFTQYVFKNAAGINLSRTTYTQINEGVPVSRENLQPGDLIFTHAGHVGIYVGNNQFIHAPRTGDVVKVSSVYKFYAARRIV